MKRIVWIAFVCFASINAFAADITLDLSVTGNDQKLTVSGKTNLPPKTALVANVANPIDQGGDGYTASSKAVVSVNEVIQFGPFTKAGGRLSPGVYTVTVATVMAELQPQEVQSFFGAHGGSLTGRQIVTLDGTSERLFWQTLQFKINPDGSVESPAPSNSQPSNPTPNAAGEVWQTVPGTDPEIYVMTNGSYNQPGCCSAKMFHTYIVANLPESDIVDASQSVMTDVEGDCETGHYNEIAYVFFAGKNRSGTPSEVTTEPEVVVRKLIPGSPLEKAFDLLCKIARERK